MKKFVVYRRVSSNMQGESGLGLEGQWPIIKHFTNDGEIIADFTEVQSAKDLNRPELQKAILLTKNQDAILVVAKADRLSRDVRDALEVLDDIGEDNLLCCDCPETNRFMITMVFAFAEHERLLISIRTKAALAAKKARQLAGTDRNAPSGRKPGFTHTQEVRDRIAAGNRAKSHKYPEMVVNLANSMRDDGKTLQEIADKLNALKATAPQGGKLSPAQVRRLINLAPPTQTRAPSAS